MGLDLFKLRVFVAVVDHHGYSAAAEYLGLSQSTVSFHVQSLERQMAAHLVGYEHRAVRLTPAGERVYRFARRALREEEQLVRSIRADRASRVGLGASIAFEQRFFFDSVLAPYRSEHPDVLLSVQFSHSVALADAVLDDRVDLAYLIGWQVPTALRYEHLHDAEFMLLVAPDHPLAEQDRVSPQDVAAAGLIATSLDDVEWVHYGRVLREIGLGRADVTVEINGIQARMLAARAGLGVLGVFHPAYVGPPMYDGLVSLRLDRAMPTVEVGLVTRRVGELSHDAEGLADRIRAASRSRPVGASGSG